MKPLCISCEPADLDQGLFGNVYYYVFQVLPYLYERKLFPVWEIRAKHYGDPPNFLVIPGALDLAYTPPKGPYEKLTLSELRRRHAQILGNDWPMLHHIWKTFFKVPDRITQQADRLFPRGKVLGIHYRGTDKQTATWDSNPISQKQFIALILDFLQQRPAFESIIAASDDYSFGKQLALAVTIPITSLGSADFHLAEPSSGSASDKSDQAMLDCIMLSRCECLVETSSGLPSFAKLFNPGLEIYRCAASKLFSNMPYFPVAYIPVLPVSSQASRDILKTTMALDWTLDPATRGFQGGFAYKPRWPLNHKLFTLADKLGASSFVARLANGYR